VLIPVPIWEYPYGNWDPLVSNSRMETVITFFIWGSPNPYGDYCMKIYNASKVTTTMLPFNRNTHKGLGGNKTLPSCRIPTRNSTKSTVNLNTTMIPQISPPWWCRLPLLWRVNYGNARSNTDNPFGGVQQVSFPLIFLSLGKYQKKSFTVSRANNNKKQAETSGNKQTTD
jgi:hypothetical protein